MKYAIKYQYKAPNRSRPDDYQQMDDLNPSSGEPFVLAAVGDTVILTLTDENPKMYKVLTRNFSYMVGGTMNACYINIVVTDVEQDDMAARLKE